jgi:hypothetical protein
MKEDVIVCNDDDDNYNKSSDDNVDKRRDLFIKMININI